MPQLSTLMVLLYCMAQEQNYLFQLMCDRGLSGMHSGRSSNVVGVETLII